MAKSTPIPTAAREAVWERQKGRCLRCGVAPYSEVHHRQRRRVAGHALYVLIGLCKTCHDYVHANPRESRSYGWIVSAFAETAETLPVETWLGWMLLDAEGGARSTDAPDYLEL